MGVLVLYEHVRFIETKLKLLLNDGVVRFTCSLHSKPAPFTFLALKFCVLNYFFITYFHKLTWNPKDIAGGTFISNNQTLYFHGSGVSAILDVAESLDLTVETYFGNYFESFALVDNGTAEMGGLLATQESQLSHDLAYLHPLDSETSDVYFRQPPADAAKYTIFRPFSKNLWIVLLSFVLVVSLISRRSLKISKFSTFLKIIILAVDLMIGRPYVHFDLIKVSQSLAILRLIMSVFGIIISSIYIGKIASIFVMQEDLVKTPNDLIKYKYKLNTYSSVHVHRVFENYNKNQETAHQINFTEYLSYIANVVGKSDDDPRQTLFSFPDGFLPPALYLLNYTQELCSIAILKSTRKTPRSFCIRKDSLLRENINLRILQLIERGLNHRHQVNFKGKFKYSCLKQDTEFNQLTFKYVQLGFVPLFVGFVLAIMIDLIMRLMVRTGKTDKEKETKRAFPATLSYLTASSV